MDVPYVRTFLEDLSPARLRLVAALNGLALPPAQDFDYCDLGAGHGDTTVVLAAAYPRARFVGVDLNPEHVATARALAASGDLENARFVERDFADLGGQEVPSLEYVCAHGVLSWIAPQTRAAMLALVSARLKPGGLFYVGYNSLPGWAVIEPLRRLLSDHARSAPGNTRERAQAAVDLANQLAAAGSRYFTRNPPALDMLATMEAAGLPYVVHEYLHAHWTPMYFADLARELSAFDLHFVGQLPAYLNDRDFAVPPGVAAVLKHVGDRNQFESLMGYATNQFFRRDVFVKGRPAPSPALTQAYLDRTPFTSLGGNTIARTARTAYHAIDFVGEVFEALLPALEEGAAPLEELVQRPELARFGIERARNALLRLIIGAQVAPVLGPTRSAPQKAGLFRLPSAYNRAVLQRRLSVEAPADAPFVLASKVAGTGIVLSHVQVLVLRLLTEVPPADRPGWIRAMAEQTPITPRVAPTERALLRELDRMEREQLSKLVELGILEPV